MKTVFDFAGSDCDLRKALKRYHEYMDREYGKTITQKVDLMRDIRIGQILHVEAVMKSADCVTFKEIPHKYIDFTEDVYSETMETIMSMVRQGRNTVWVPADDLAVCVTGIEFHGDPLDDPHNWFYRLTLTVINEYDI